MDNQQKFTSENSLLINHLNITINNLGLKRCKYGWMLFFSPYIGKCFELYGEYSESEVEIFRHYLREGHVAIDVGAFIGDLTVPASQFVGDSGRVFAFESNPETFNILAANLALNDIKNVKPINAFVADRQDGSVANEVWGQYANVGETWAPQFIALDALDIQRLDFLKIDVDGFELDVIKSGINLINKYRPVLYFENDMKPMSRDLIAFVLSLGYRIYFHPAPIFQPNNFFENTNNHWAPRSIVSLMMLALPDDQAPPLIGAREVLSADDWWDFL
jgi:FkbM family methyltransferase